MSMRWVRPKLDGVVLGFIDLAGLHRVKAVPAARLASVARDGVTLSRQLDASLPDDSHAEDAVQRGPDVRLVPDLGRLVRLAAVPGWAWAPADRVTHDGLPHALCTRSFLRAVVAELAQRGLSAQVGVEVEWTAGHRDGDRLRPLGDGPGFGMAAFIPAADYLRDLISTLGRQGVPVSAIHPEGEPGTFEVSTAPEPPVAAADTVLVVRDTIRAVSHRHDLAISFAPVVEVNGPSNGAHLHLSLWRGRCNLLGERGPAGHRDGADAGFGDEAAAFVAGMLRSLDAILAVATPSTASYLRLVSGLLSGNVHAWSWSSRYTALRAVAAHPGRRHEANVEVKCFDSTANPYLVLGCLLAAGLAGLQERLQLPAEADGDEVAAAVARGGDLRLLPGNLASAIVRLETDPVPVAAMGPVLTAAVLANRRAEVAADRTRAPGSALAAIRWRY